MRPRFRRTEKVARAELTPDQRVRLWEQFVGVHTDVQKDFDSSVRTLAAGGVVATASLATALNGFNSRAGWSVILFLTALACNVASYGTAQADMNARLDSLAKNESDKVDRTRWTMLTTVLNLGQGVAIIAGGALLALFIRSKVPHS